MKKTRPTSHPSIQETIDNLYKTDLEVRRVVETLSFVGRHQHQLTYVYVVVDIGHNEVYGVYTSMELAKMSIEDKDQADYSIQGIKLNH